MLQLNFLGDMRIAVEGMERDLPRSKKTRALLAYLAVTGRPHRRDRLCAMFWEVPDDPRGALRWSLSKLRALVDEPGRTRIVADREVVGFDPEGADIDVLELRQRLGAELESMTVNQLVKAETSFRGDFLEGLDLESCPEFQSWCLAEREELRVLRCRVLKRLVVQLAAQPELALPHVRTLLRLDPFDEALRAMLLRVLAAAGRHDEAEKQYELSRRTLAELGAPPSGELQRAWRDLRRVSQVSSSPNATSKFVAAPSALTAAPLEIQDLASSGVLVGLHAPTDTTERSTSLEPRAERKQITVLVAVVGRVSDLDAENDPETTMHEIGPALEAVKDIIRRYDGSLSMTQADGVTALFGAPVAHEDHAVRACQSAIAMQAAVRERMGGSPALRLGLHSGEVVVRATGDGATARFEAFGPVVSLASRICALAPPGNTILTTETARRAEGFVQVQQLGSGSFADSELRDDVLALRGTTNARTRWEIRAARGLTPFIGRDAEMEALVRAMRRVEADSGQVVAVVADPGIGKSRLVHEFVRSAVSPRWTVLETSGAPHDAKAIYRPISELLRAWFAVEERDSKSEIEHKVRTRIEDQYPELRPAVPALMSLLDLSVTDADWVTLSPHQRRRRILDAFKALLACECRKQPLVLLFEDLHWIDGETQAVLDTLVDSLGALRILLLATHRPEYRHGWVGKSYFSQLRLLPLATETAERLLEALIGSDRSLRGLRRELVARTEGTPLFVEETVRALAEAGAFSGRPGDYRQGRSLATFEIPSTIQAVIAARIDRLMPSTKTVLQVASVIGREVPHTLLKEVAGLPEDRLHDALAELRAAEFLYEVRFVPEIEYSFKHALTHEVAYGSVLRDRRRTIHIEIVQTIERLNRDRLDEQVERLAHHSVKGRLWDQAIQYLYCAANKAIHRSAHRQAMDFLHQGLELIPKISETRARLQIELDYQKAMGVTLMAVKGWGAQEVSDAYVRALTLAEALADDRELFVVLRGQGQFHMIRGEVQIARGFGDRCVALAAKGGDPGMEIETHHLFWSNSFFMGDYIGARHHAERGISLYDRQRDHRLTYIYSGHDPGVCCRCFSGLALWQQGEVEGSLARCSEALLLASDLSHPLTTALAYWGLSYVHILRREPIEAQGAAEQEIAICEEFLLPLLLSQGQFQLGWALAAQGALDEGIALMRKGLEAISVTGSEMGRPYFSALFAEALAKSGRPSDGLSEIESALHIVKKNRAYFQLPEIQRLKAELMLMLPNYDIDAVIACLREATTTAREQAAPLSELRAATSLARVLLDKRRRAEARQLLTDLCRRVDEFADSAEFREARTLLTD